MTSQLLDTKFYAPRPRSGLVPRPALTDRLIRGTESKLTLISAPAGFGKSTLLAEWLASRDDDALTAWLSLDAGDDHPSGFWTNLIAAIQTVRPGIGVRSLNLLSSDQPLAAVLAPLLNDLMALDHDIILVLDDYHTIGSAEIHDGMTYLLDHLPPRVRLVVASRTDPPFPLARLRARRELIEVRAADLRFTPEQAAAYFNGVMGLGLSAEQVATLEGRTEGWVAALHLAGLSMQGRGDVTSFIAGFAGDDRYIVDYLVEEVLQREPEPVRDFLLQTSILARISGPLAEALTGQTGAQATLEALHRRNVFLIPLDGTRRWFRYHHLFADVLQAHLLAERPEQVSELHRRAAEWHETAGDRMEAIHHALAGRDFGRAADLVELAIPATRRARQESVLRAWLEALPEDHIRMRPNLSDAVAGSHLVRGDVEGVEAALQVADDWVTRATAGSAEGMVVVDERAFRELPAWIAIHRAGLARLRGDVAATMTHARAALEVVHADDLVGRGAAAALLGLASWSTGDLEAATSRYEEAIAVFESAGFLSDLLACSIGLADMRRSQGRLTEARALFERGLALATRPDGTVLRGAADMHVGISEVLRERNDLAGAARHLATGRQLGPEHGLPQNPYRSRVAEALIRHAEGAPEAAVELLDDAARVYAGDFSPDIRPVAAVRARVLIAAGRLPDAWAWARGRGLTADDDLDYVREFEHATLARLLLAEGVRERSDDRLAAAGALLERLSLAAEAGGRAGGAIDILVAQAGVRQARGDAAGGLVSLERAITLAEPEGYVRVFVEGGPPIVALLKVAARSRTASSYVRRLLAAMAPADGRAPAEQALIEPLSERELEVLRLLGSDLDGPDIARELVVSLPTVRTHTRNVYAKLGVNSRREAVRRAAELGLLGRTENRRPRA